MSQEAKLLNLICLHFISAQPQFPVIFFLTVWISTPKDLSSRETRQKETIDRPAVTDKKIIN